VRIAGPKELARRVQSRWWSTDMPWREVELGESGSVGGSWRRRD
jgi:hypothetical protein